jgi:NitT/TauT family transport system ATP-binding protein
MSNLSDPSAEPASWSTRISRNLSANEWPVLEDRQREIEAMSYKSTSNVLEVVDLYYRYPSGVETISGIDFALGDGEILAILGPSGCGKSTLLALIAELLEPTSGKTLWTDRGHPNERQSNRELAMVFQKDTVLPWRTVEKNIQFGMECAHLSRQERRENTQRLLEMGGLTAFAKAYPRALSGGMRRRLALLMGLSVQPRVLLLDEPFAAVDEPTRIQLLGDVLNLAYTYGISVVLVTHDIAEAISIADRLIILTNRPSCVHRVVPVPFGHDRDILLMRETDEYAHLYRDVWREVWGVIRGGS